MTSILRRYSFSNLLRKAVYVLFGGRTVLRLCRQLRFYFFTRCWPAHIQKNVFVNAICLGMKMGKDANLYANTIFEVAETAQVNIGDNFTLSYGSLIACSLSVTIGNDVMIGEYSSLRDSSHSYHDKHVPYNKQPDKALPIRIGNNVWIGRGSIVFPGTVIEDGVIIAANSVVKGHLRSNCIYAGAPLQLIKELEPLSENAGSAEEICR